MRALVFVVAAGIGGCSLHPVPDYGGPEKTLHIAKRIRCEARDAVKSIFVSKARESGSKRTRDYAERLHSEVPPVTAIEYAELDEVTRKFFERYDSTGVAYNFRFDITETGGAGASLDLARPLSGGSLSLNVGARADLTRQNQRSFLLNDTFKRLLTEMTGEHCQGYLTGANWIYPIAGEIGLAEMIKTFVDLDATGSLVKLDDDQPSATMIDVLEFTTQFAVGAKPTLVLEAAGRRWQATGASAGELGIGAGRTDKNRVQIALSAELVEAVPISTSVNARYREAPRGARGNPRARTPSELNASRAIQNQNLLQFFDNTRVLSDRFGLPSY